MLVFYFAYCNILCHHIHIFKNFGLAIYKSFISYKAIKRFNGFHYFNPQQTLLHIAFWWRIQCNINQTWDKHCCTLLLILLTILLLCDGVGELSPVQTPLNNSLYFFVVYCKYINIKFLSIPYTNISIYAVSHTFVLVLMKILRLISFLAS